MTADNRAPQKTAGYLEKRGKLKFMNSWKKYWFVLEGHLLLYYGSKDDYDSLSPCRGSITLGPICTVKPYSAVPIAFQITTRSTTITLRAETVAEQTKWMQAFLYTLNQNQNANKSPTKLNHFRYSSESLNVVVDNKEDCSSTPTSSPQQTPKAKEEPLIDRLQKLGARSYGNNFSVQNQILEGVKNSRQRSFVKEAVAEQESKINTAKKREDVVLEDEDFCVCTLGKEASEEEESNNNEHKDDSRNNLSSEPEKKLLLNQHERTKPGNYGQVKIAPEFHLHANPSLGSCSKNNETTKPTHEKLMNDRKLKNIQNLFLEFEEKLSTGHDADCNKKENMVNTENVYAEPDNESPISSEMKNNPLRKLLHRSHLLDEQQYPEPIKPKNDLKFYSHAEGKDKSSSEIQAEPHKERKLKNIPNVHSEPKDLTSTNSQRINYSESQKGIHESNLSVERQRKKLNNTEPIQMNNDQKFHIHDDTKHESTSGNNCEIQAPMYVEPHKERKLKNVPNVHSEPKDLTSTNSQRINYSESQKGFVGPNLSIERQRKRPNNSKPIQTNIDLTYYSHAETKEESSPKNNTEIQTPTYAEPHKERKLKNIPKLHTDPEDVTSTSREKRNYSESKNVINSPHLTVDHQREQPDTTKPTKLDRRFHLYEEIEDKSSSKNNSSIPIYAQLNTERKLKNNLNLHTEPKTETSKIDERTSYTESNSPRLLNIREKPNKKEPIRIKSEFKFHSHGKNGGEASVNNSCGSPVPNYAEPGMKEKLTIMENIYTEPEDEPSNCVNKNEQICTKPSNKEPTKMKLVFKHHYRGKLTEEPSVKSPAPIHAKPPRKGKLTNIENIYAEPDDEPSNCENKNEQICTKPIKKEPTRMKFDIKFHSDGKPKEEPSLKSPTPTHAEAYRKGKLKHIENIYEEPKDEPLLNHEDKNEQKWRKPNNIDPTKIKTDLKAHSLVKPREEPLLDHCNNPRSVYTEPTKEQTLKNIKNIPRETVCSDYYITDNELYAEPNMKPVNSPRGWLVQNEKHSIRTEELQCEMDLDEEATGEFECDNDIYGSPSNLFNTPPKTSDELYKGPNGAFSKKWERKFQFPPPPTDEDLAVYAEPRFSPTEKDEESSKLKRKSRNDKFEETQQAEFQLDNELYGETTTRNDNFEYPEYEEPEIICDNDIYAEPNIQLLQAGSVKTANEVEYCNISELEEKSGNFYSQPFERNVDDSNLYEEPEMFQIKNKEEMSETLKAKKKNRRQKSEPWSKNFKIEETKKNEGFIQKLFKQATWKHSDRSDKHHDLLPGEDVDDTLVVLTEIQQLLEKKKQMIKTMAMQSRNSESKQINSRTESADLDKKGRAKSYPSRSPDLLKDLNEHLVHKSAFLGLVDEYSTVHDLKKNEEDENMYSEVVPERHSKEFNHLIQEILRRKKNGTQEMTKMMQGGTIKSPETIDSKNGQGTN